MRVQGKQMMIFFAGLFSLTAGFIFCGGFHPVVGIDPGMGMRKSLGGQQKRLPLAASCSSPSKLDQSICGGSFPFPSPSDTEASDQIEIEHDAFLEMAAASIRHPDPQVRIETLIRIAESGDDRAIDFLIAALADNEPSIRQLSVTALHRFGRRIPAQSLIGMALCSEDPQLRSEVLALLHRFSPPDSAEIMLLEAKLRLEAPGNR
jgi:hypothetical protein